MEIQWKYNGNTMEIEWKYNGNKPSKLGEIHQIRISTYFTERSEVYFYCISF